MLSSETISAHSATHSLQIATSGVGPATRDATWLRGLPQNAHRIASTDGLGPGGSSVMARDRASLRSASVGCGAAGPVCEAGMPSGAVPRPPFRLASMPGGLIATPDRTGPHGPKDAERSEAHHRPTHRVSAPGTVIRYIVHAPT